MDILADLNPAQKQAAETINGPVLILAGPGSGKTRVITHRIAYLIRVCGVSPHHIIAVTFTNKAAREMESRLARLTGTSLRDLTLGTFHSVCARILRRDGAVMGISPRFVIYDDSDQIGLIKQALKDIGLDAKQYAPRAISSAIGAAKSQSVGPADYLGRSRSYFEEVVGRVYERYEQLLGESSALDFDDLLMKTVRLFREHPAILGRYQARFQHLLVDEFQDTNLVQYELVRQLGARHRNICVVGDPDQSIYSWRSADLRNILNFEKDFPEAKVVLLEQNYRSTKNILETAANLIAANQQRKDKGLWTDNEAGELVKLVEAYTEQEEAQFVVREIEQLVENDTANLGECAVLYRTNAQSRILEEVFVRYGTPYKLVAGTRFYERREVKDIIAYLRLIQNPQDSVSLLRVINLPGRGIGQQTLAKLFDLSQLYSLSQFEVLLRISKLQESDDPPFYPHIARALVGFAELMQELIAASQEMGVVELLDLVVERTAYRDFLLSQPDGEDRWENVLELRTVAQQYHDLIPPEGLAAFLEGVTLVADVDSLDETASGVTLITLHQAKGLEFPVVFIVGMEEGILPHIKSFDDPAQMEEERRLCYVGITRAKRLVYLVRTFRRSLMGSSNVNQPSRFLADIPRHLISGGEKPRSKESAAAVYSWNRSAPPDATPSGNGDPAPDVKAGSRVRHAAFGDGVVVSCQAVDDDAEVVVAFRGAGVKKLLLSFARLERVE